MLYDKTAVLVIHVPQCLQHVLLILFFLPGCDNAVRNTNHCVSQKVFLLYIFLAFSFIPSHKLVQIFFSTPFPLKHRKAYVLCLVYCVSFANDKTIDKKTYIYIYSSLFFIIITGIIHSSLKKNRI
jgi:hypothetical protein